MQQTEDILKMTDEEYMEFCKKESFLESPDVKRFYLYDKYTNVYIGFEDKEKNIDVEDFYDKSEYSTDIKPIKPKEGFIAVYNDITKEWLEVKDTLGEIYYDYSGEPLYLNLNLKELPNTNIRPSFYSCSTFNPEKQEWEFNLFSLKAEIYNYFTNKVEDLKDTMLTTKCDKGTYVIREEVLNRLLIKIKGLEYSTEESAMFQDSYGESHRLNLEDLKNVYSEIFTVINKREIEFENFLLVFDKIEDDDITNPESDFYVYYTEFKEDIEKRLTKKENTIRVYLESLKSNMKSCLEALE